MLENKRQETKTWDRDLLLERVLHNKEIYDAVLEAFITDIPLTAKNLIAEIQSKNYIEIASLAHIIKGSAFNVTANVLGNIVSEIELAAKENNIEGVIKMLPNFKENLSILINEFTAQLK